MSEFNNIDCCFECKKQFNNDLCDEYCKNKNKCKENYCVPGACEYFENKLSDPNLNFKVISKEEYEELLEYKHMYLDLCK